MIELGQPVLGSSVSSILCLGAHADDIEIGCGGFLLRLLQMNPGVRVTWSSFPATMIGRPRPDERRARAAGGRERRCHGEGAA